MKVVKTFATLLLALGVLTTASVALADRSGEEVQSPRSQQVEVPRGQDAQAPRGQDAQAL